jgi:hypothetical protein
MTNCKVQPQHITRRPRIKTHLVVDPRTDPGVEVEFEDDGEDERDEDAAVYLEKAVLSGNCLERLWLLSWVGQ